MNELHRALAAKILTHIRTSGMATGQHLPEQLLGAVCATSRAPIRAALFHLAEQGVLSRIPNKGFFIQHLRLDGIEPPRERDTHSDEALYLKIAEDRLMRVLDPHRRRGLDRAQRGPRLDVCRVDRLGSGLWRELPAAPGDRACRATRAWF
jgi:hypothetical protein